MEYYKFVKSIKLKVYKVNTANMKQLFLYFSLLIFSFSLSSCSPQKRLSRLLKKHPELLIADTIKLKDTILIPGTKIDTFFHKSALKDTLKFSKEKLNLKLFEINDTIYVNADVKADTVYLERKVVVEKMKEITKKTERFRIWKFFQENYLLVIIILVFIKIIVFKKNIK